MAGWGGPSPSVSRVCGAEPSMPVDLRLQMNTPLTSGAEAMTWMKTTRVPFGKQTLKVTYKEWVQYPCLLDGTSFRMQFMMVDAKL